MRMRVSPSAVSGTLPANPSKSHAQRVIALAALASGTSQLDGTGSSADVLSAEGIASALGAAVFREENKMIITGGGNLSTHAWHCGESGLCLRMFSAIAALYDTPITLTASGTLLKRSTGFLQKTFAQLGVRCKDTQGFPPLTVYGPLHAGQYSIDGSAGSQLITGLLIAMPLLKSDSVLVVNKLKSRPYIDLTLDAMHDFGVKVSHDDYQTFYIPGNQLYRSCEISVQGDWSGASCILAAGAIAGQVSIRGLQYPSPQADAGIIDILKSCGARVSITPEEVKVKKNTLLPFSIDATHCPDLFPPLTALAAYCDGISRITGVHRLSTKESDRAQTLMTEFQHIGVRVWQEEDTLCVRGGGVAGGKTSAHDDHRIAMALAVAALGASSPIEIDGAECVRKSYPDFFSHLRQLGASVDEMQ